MSIDGRLLRRLRLLELLYLFRTAGSFLMRAFLCTRAVVRELANKQLYGIQINFNLEQLSPTRTQSPPASIFRPLISDTFVQSFSNTN